MQLQISLSIFIANSLNIRTLKKRKRKKQKKIFHCIITSRFFVANEPEVYSGKKINKSKGYL